MNDIKAANSPSGTFMKKSEPQANKELLKAAKRKVSGISGELLLCLKPFVVSLQISPGLKLRNRSFF